MCNLVFKLFVKYLFFTSEVLLASMNAMILDNFSLKLLYVDALLDHLQCFCNCQFLTSRFLCPPFDHRRWELLFIVRWKKIVIQKFECASLFIIVKIFFYVDFLTVSYKYYEIHIKLKSKQLLKSKQVRMFK